MGSRVIWTIFLQNELVIPDTLNLDFNIDGVPLSKSSSSCFWLILARVFNLRDQPIITVGVYFGKSKPKVFSEFLTPFVKELKDIIDVYNCNGKIIKIEIRAFILDAPARCSTLGTKSHCGYNGCSKCCQEGTFLKNRITFPDNDSMLRTNDSFRNRLDDNYHNYTSVLEELEFDIVKDIPLDYMHVLLLGVVKRLIRMWLT